MSFEFILIIIVVSYLRKTLQTATHLPVWNKRLMQAMYAAAACLVAQVVFSSAGVSWLSGFITFIGYVFLGALLYAIFKLDEFKPAKFLFFAILPYLIAAVLDDLVRFISGDFYSRWHNVTDAIKTFAFIWGVGFWLVTRKQQKELIKARAKALEEEKNNKVINQMKAQLEIQVAERTAELTEQKEELETALKELKATQAQLIQSEKMASLGELTAGIAHEIQNPLNFVSNFSDVNNELLDEMVAEIEKNNVEEVKLIAKDVKDNNGKIIFHGKRADAIVKGMLQHSRKNTGQKEPTDINALADEYLRLSFHGLRAKDKSFNSNFETHFDESIQKINVIQQDIGRVLLNLFNNAFYAVSEKKSTADADYQPMVSVQTKNLNSKIEIIIRDNGGGIPKNVADKIFQPFFTTKPTGQGTGLGLSISYDIIKSHGGEIRVESKEGEGTSFFIQLPS